MKQENLFVAELYHFLLPFIDCDKECYFCLDGGAAKHHASLEKSLLKDAVLPDLWFYLLGKQQPIGIEAKVFCENTLSFRKAQIMSWNSQGLGVYRPNFWVATNRNLSTFHCWYQSTMVSRLDSTNSTVDNISLSMKDYPADFTSNNIQEIALFILQNSNHT